MNKYERLELLYSKHNVDTAVEYLRECAFVLDVTNNKEEFFPEEWIVEAVVHLAVEAKNMIGDTPIVN